MGKSLCGNKPVFVNENRTQSADWSGQGRHQHVATLDPVDGPTGGIPPQLVGVNQVLVTVTTMKVVYPLCPMELAVWDPSCPGCKGSMQQEADTELLELNL